MVHGRVTKLVPEWYSQRLACYRMVQSEVSLLQNGTVRGLLDTEWYSKRLASLLQNGTVRGLLVTN